MHAARNTVRQGKPARRNYEAVSKRVARPRRVDPPLPRMKSVSDADKQWLFATSPCACLQQPSGTRGHSTGSQPATRLTRKGHQVAAGSSQTGQNSITGEGLAEELTNAKVLIDLSNSPSFEDPAVLEFFSKATSNLVSAAKAKGVRHYVTLSIVGTERLPSSGYFRAKVVQAISLRHQCRGRAEISSGL